MLDYTLVVGGTDDDYLSFGVPLLAWAVKVLPDALEPGHDTADYTAQLIDLLPRGAAWSRQAGSTIVMLMRAFAAELARVHRRSSDVVVESDPRTTSELLLDWERVTGLPEECIAEPQTLQERRAALLARLTNAGGQSKAFFIDLALRLGFSITIDEFFSEAAAIAAGIPYTGSGWAYTWRVNAPATTVRTFKVGQSKVGEPLREWGNQVLECAIGHYKPAHTIALFAYA